MIHYRLRLWLRGLYLTLGLLGIDHCQAAPPLVLAFSELPPWKIHDTTGDGGAYTEIIRELARRSGLQLKIQHCPLKRCLLMLAEGDADIIIGVKDSSLRNDYIQFLPTPYRKNSSDKVFYVVKGRAGTIRSYGDLQKMRIGVKNETKYFSRFDDDKEIKKDFVENNNANFQKLLLGRIDAVLIAEDQGEAIISQLGIRDQVEKAAYRESDRTSRAIGISKKSPHWRQFDEFEAAMSAMVKDGTLKSIFRREYYQAFKIPFDSIRIE